MFDALYSRFRDRKVDKLISNPYPLVNFEPVSDGNTTELKECDPVPECLASDYNIPSNVMRGAVSVVSARLACDLVDVDSRLNSFID